MKKRIVCLLLAALLLASLLPVTAAAANAVSPDSYLQKGDYIVISPAEKWNDSGKRIAVKTTEWELTAQHSGTANGNDVQTWKYGVSDKFYIENAETKSNGVTYVRIQCKNFRESGGGRYWDIEGRSKKPGGNLHVWSFKSGAASQWFYLEEDKDGDGETFFLKNMNSNLYLAPENYFKNPKNDCGMKRNSWSEQGCNVVQSNYAFRWRIQVLNRDAVVDAGGKDKYANWMSLLPDSRYLSELNIPGTHDSGTTNVEGSWNSSDNKVACQKYFIEQQLYAGVRSLDIRTTWNTDSHDMVLVHGSKTFVCHTPDHGNSRNKKLRDVLDQMISFLQNHQRETIIMTLKIDGGTDHVLKEQLQNVLKDYVLDKTKSRYFYQWGKAPEEKNSLDAAAKAISAMRQNFQSPTLGQTRGKIVILSRVDFGSSLDLLNSGYNGMNISLLDRQKICSYMGPDLSQWDNRYESKYVFAQPITDRDGVKVWVQDAYSCGDYDKYSRVFSTIMQLNGNLYGGAFWDYFGTYDALNGAGRPKPQDFVFNYTSKTTSDTKGLSPLGGAKYMNDYIYNSDYFTPNTKNAVDNPRLGIVVMDYVNKQLCRRIIDRNDFPSSIGLSDFVRDPSKLLFAGLDTYDPDTYEQAAPLAVLASEQAEVNDAQPSEEIVWPNSASLTYGYLLGEATLNFAETASGGQAGRFRFEEPEKMLSATNNDSPAQEWLTFIPAGSEEPGARRQIPVTVDRRPLPIKIADYEVEYGDVFRRADLSVTAGGYLLADDLAHLNDYIEKYDIRWLLTDSSGMQYTNPYVPPTNVLGSGTIELRSGNGSGTIEDPRTEFPNYDAHVENGTWSVVPRTVTVEWNYAGGVWTAKLCNLLPGDEVFASVSADGTLTLTGADAEKYQIADEDASAPSEEPDDITGILAGLTGQNQTGKLLPFTDVPKSYYAADAIRWAWENGWFSGVSGKRFAPEQGLSRAMLVTVLWRMEGEPRHGISGFTDVLPGGWYEKAVAWAAFSGIVSGTAEGVFSPDAAITREQLAVILWRYAGSPQPSGSLSGFADAGEVSAYAAEAMAWAVEQGIVTGSNGRLLPKSGATRAQTALMLQRFAARQAQ